MPPHRKTHVEPPRTSGGHSSRRDLRAALHLASFAHDAVQQEEFQTRGRRQVVQLVEFTGVTLELHHQPRARPQDQQAVVPGPAERCVQMRRARPLRLLPLGLAHGRCRLERRESFRIRDCLHSPQRHLPLPLHHVGAPRRGDLVHHAVRTVLVRAPHALAPTFRRRASAVRVEV